MKRALHIATALLISSAALIPVASSFAQVSVNINIGTEPPPPRHERIPAARPGYVWAPGYWNWNGHQHVWRSGHWERARSGYIYQPSAWQHEDGGWRLHKGSWKRDPHYRKHDKHHDRHDDHRGDHHCPPGQAKKGHC